MQKSHYNKYDCLLLFCFVFVVTVMLALGSCNIGKAQSSCTNPYGPIVLNTAVDTCYTISAGDTVEACFTFTAPGPILLFTSVPPGSCSSLQVSAILYDAGCNVVTTNAFGVVLVTPLQNYVWCLSYVCTGVHDTVFCPEYYDFSNPVPVTWLNAAGKYCGDKDYIKLWWVTSSETNNDRFEIEHSASGKYFDYTGSVKGSGTSQKINEYRFNHTAPTDGVNVYRIKQIDYNGNYSYSNVFTVYKIKPAAEPWTVYDVTGRQIAVLREEELEQLGKGFYFLVTKNHIRKFVK